MWGWMVEYWHYTSDTSYNEVVSQAILAQASPTDDFMMSEEAGQLGNDDQVFWGLTAMTAAERSFPIPSTASVTYIDLAKGVFNDMAGPHWNTSTCNGGLQWQFNPNNAGFYYKSSVANGGFFQLAARLARNHYVYDGTDDTGNCTGIDHDQWSYNAGTMLLGTAILANISSSNSTSIWATRAPGLLTSAQHVFFSPYPNATNVLFESMCEEASTCNNDQFSFKAYLSRWMTAATQMLPSLQTQVLDLIAPSTQAAALSCSGMNASICGTKWYVGGWDGTKGLGQQMAALDTIQGLLVNGTAPPLIVPGS
ncbi:MAG: hypothetical protein Q9175_007306 [Cornicularia normoerica]